MLDMLRKFAENEDGASSMDGALILAFISVSALAAYMN